MLHIAQLCLSLSAYVSLLHNSHKPIDQVKVNLAEMLLRWYLTFYMKHVSPKLLVDILYEACLFKALGGVTVMPAPLSHVKSSYFIYSLVSSVVYW